MGWVFMGLVFVGFSVFNLRKLKQINMAKLIVISKGLSKNLTLLEVATLYLYCCRNPHLSLSTLEILMLINSLGREQQLMGSSQNQSDRLAQC